MPAAFSLRPVLLLLPTPTPSMLSSMQLHGRLSNVQLVKPLDLHTGDTSIQYNSHYTNPNSPKSNRYPTCYKVPFSDFVEGQSKVCDNRPPNGHYFVPPYKNQGQIPIFKVKVTLTYKNTI